jgi:hypothetical protein
MRYWAIALSIRARAWNVIRRSAGPPIRRPNSSMPRKSSPSLVAAATGSPVTA